MSYALNSIGPAAIALAMFDSRTPTPESDSLKTTLIFKQPVNDKFNNTQAYLIIIITYYSQSGNSNQLNERINDETRKHALSVSGCSLQPTCSLSCLLYYVSMYVPQSIYMYVLSFSLFACSLVPVLYRLQIDTDY